MRVITTLVFVLVGLHYMEIPGCEPDCMIFKL